MVACSLALWFLDSAYPISAGVSSRGTGLEPDTVAVVGIVDRVDLQPSQLRHHLVDKQAERLHDLIMFEGTEGKFSEKTVRARLCRDLPNLAYDCVRGAADEGIFPNCRIDVKELLFSLFSGNHGEIFVAVAAVSPSAADPVPEINPVVLGFFVCPLVCLAHIDFSHEGHMRPAAVGFDLAVDLPEIVEDFPYDGHRGRAPLNGAHAFR